jgi:hypothetical protein
VVNRAVQSGDSLVQELSKLVFGHIVDVGFKERKIRLTKLLGQEGDMVLHRNGRPDVKEQLLQWKARGDEVVVLPTLVRLVWSYADKNRNLRRINLEMSNLTDLVRNQAPITT